MLSLRSSHRIRVGNDTGIFDTLHERHVAAAICTNVWSDEAVEFTDRMVRKRKYNKPYSAPLNINRVGGELDSNAAYNKDMERINRVVMALMGSLFGKGLWEDRSRLEPAIGNGLGNHADVPHIDGNQIGAMSMPSGVTPEFVADYAAGKFDDEGSFTPANPVTFEQAFIPLPNRAMIVAKGLFFPDGDPDHMNALIHRRNTARIAARPDQGRWLIHSVVG